MKRDGQSKLFRLCWSILFLLIAGSGTEAAPNETEGTISAGTISAGAISALKKEGTLLRLRADYEGATRISDRLKQEYPERAVGYTMNLNTMVTRLSWDDKQTQFDETIRRDSTKVLSLCQAQIKAHPDNYEGYYHCGQAHFALSYLHALRGNYYRAGTNGSNAIDNLERTLKLKPDLIDAKMHLGFAYYYADNLPPIVKAFSRLLWFIPRGNSEKSIPYIKQVTEEGEFFKEVAKFLYSGLLIYGNDEDQRQAEKILKELVTAYPENRRFQIRYISLLTELNEFAESMATAQEFIATEQQYHRDQMDITLVRLWITRAHMGLHDIEGAVGEFSKIIETSVDEKFPSWGKSWFMLTRAQIQDLQNKRNQALTDYQRVVELFSDYASAEVLAAAREGLETPYKFAAVP